MHPVSRIVLMLVSSVSVPSQRMEAQRFRAAHVLTAGAITPLQEAAIVAQGIDSLPFLDSTVVSELMTVLVRVRQAAPTLAGAVPEGEFWAAELSVDDELAAGMKRIGRKDGRSWYHKWRLPRAGRPALDSLITQFAAESLTLRVGAGPGDNDNPVLRIVFRYAMNVPAILETFRRVPGVLAAATSPDDGPQTGHRYRVSRAIGVRRLDIDQALGDCTMACARWLRWGVVVRGDSVQVVTRDTVRAG